MKAIRLLILLIPLLLLAACHSGRHREMLALLDEADSLNRVYAQLHSDSLLRHAADFFDRHGSPNKQVRAHNLLGCAYRDQGQATEALQAWHDATDRADTLSKAGHFHTCRKQLMRSEKLFVSFLWQSDNKLYFCIHKAHQELRAAPTNLPTPPA